MAVNFIQNNLAFSLAILCFIAFPLIIFSYEIKRRDRIESSKKKGREKIQDNEHDKLVIDDIDIEDRMIDDLIDNTDERKYESMSDYELQKTYRKLKMSIPSIDSMVTLKRLPQEEKTRVRKQTALILQILAERKKEQDSASKSNESL